MSSSIVVDFEVLPDDAADRTPQQVCHDLQHQLTDPGSQLRRGEFARFAAGATLSGPGIEGAGGASYIEETAEAAAPAPEAERFDAEPGRTSAYGSTNGRGLATQGLANAELIDRITHLERQLQRTAAGGRQEAAPAPARRSAPGFGEAQASCDKCSHVQQQLEAVQTELRESNEAARMWRQRHEQSELKLKDREQLLVHAKEMWMKENVRASKLADALTTSEDKLADQEKRLAEVVERYNEAQREVRSLKHLVGDGPTEGFGGDTFRGDQKTGYSMGDPPSTGGSRIPATASTMRASFTNKDMFGGTSKTLPLSSPNLVDDGRPMSSMPLDAHTNADRFRRLCLMNDAVLYEDEILQIGIKAEYSGRDGQIAVFFGNKGSAALHAFTAQYFVKEEQALRLSASPMSQQLEGDKQVVQRVTVHMQEAFAEPPWLRIQFLLPDTSPRRIQIKLPVVLTKFCVGREVTAQEFFQIWRQQNFVLNEATSIVHLSTRFSGVLVHIARCIVFGGALRMHHGIDTNPDNFVLVGQLVDASGHSMGDLGSPADAFGGGDRERGLSLVRVEVGAGRFSGKARIVVRSSDHVVARALCESIVAQLCEANAPQSDGMVAR